MIEGRHEWTQEEKKMLHSNKTNEEIAEEIGVSICAVKKSRYYYTGHEVEPDRWRKDNPSRISVESEARILSLAKKIGVKLI